MKLLRIFTLIICAAAVGFPQFAQAQNAVNSDFTQEGIASWYGPEFDGRPTASGEIFDSTQLTAAHPSLPFGTILTVTNKHNNKVVTVRVNDRGPFVSARIVDVSKAAAEKLDMLTTGTAPVLLEISNGLTATTTPVQTETPVAAVQAEPVPAAVSQAAPAIVYQEPAYSAPASQPWPANEPVSQPVYQPVPVASVQTAPVAQPMYQQASAAQPESQSIYQQPVVTSARSWPADQPMYEPAPVVQTAPVQAPAQPVYQQPAPVAQPVYQPVPIQPVQEQVSPRQNTVVLVPAIVPSPSKVYRLQVGSFKAARNAVDSFDKLKSVGLNPAYERYEENFRVVLSGIRGADVAAVSERIAAAGFREVLIREER